METRRIVLRFPIADDEAEPNLWGWKTILGRDVEVKACMVDDEMPGQVTGAPISLPSVAKEASSPGTGAKRVITYLEDLEEAQIGDILLFPNKGHRCCPESEVGEILNAFVPRKQEGCRVSTTCTFCGESSYWQPDEVLSSRSKADHARVDKVARDRVQSEGLVLHDWVDTRGEFLDIEIGQAAVLQVTDESARCGSCGCSIFILKHVDSDGDRMFACANPECDYTEFFFLYEISEEPFYDDGEEIQCRKLQVTGPLAHDDDDGDACNSSLFWVKESSGGSSDTCDVACNRCGQTISIKESALYDCEENRPIPRGESS